MLLFSVPVYWGLRSLAGTAEASVSSLPLLAESRIVSPFQRVSRVVLRLSPPSVELLIPFIAADDRRFALSKSTQSSPSLAVEGSYAGSRRRLLPLYLKS